MTPEERADVAMQQVDRDERGPALEAIGLNAIRSLRRAIADQIRAALREARA